MGSVLWVLGIGGGVIGALVLVNLLRRRPPRSGPAVENPDVAALPQAVADIRQGDRYGRLRQREGRRAITTPRSRRARPGSAVARAEGRSVS
jgi:hypothetical protein